MSEEHYLRSELYALVRGSSEIFEFLQEGSLDGLWYWDLEKPEHEWMSPSFWRLFGYDPGSKKHLASEWQDLIFQEDLRVALTNFHRHIEDPKHPYDQVVRYRHSDGSTVWVRCRGIAIRNEDGVPVRMLGAHTDITAAKVAEEAAQTLVSELQKANDALQTFGHSVAHDLRAPLRSSRWRVEDVLESSELPIEARTMLEDTIADLETMQGIVRATMALSQLGHAAVTTVRVRTGEVVQSILVHLRAQHPGRTIRIEVTELPDVVGDPDMVRMVWTNLLSNAFKYTANREEAHIEVRGQQKHDTAYFVVADNGMGFSEEFAERAFLPFHRDSAARGIEGMGVGLSLVKAIIDHHGGTIAAKGQVDVGATLQFSLPTSPT